MGATSAFKTQEEMTVLIKQLLFIPATVCNINRAKSNNPEVHMRNASAPGFIYSTKPNIKWRGRSQIVA
jgi:hypothetical protein